MMLLIAMIVVYLITNLFGYIVHWCFHQSWAGWVRQSHLTHHHLYTGVDYLSETYRDAGKDNSFRLFIVPSLLLFIPPAVLYVLCVIPLYVMIVLIVEMIIIGWMHNYLHDSFHIKNHFLSRMPLIKKIFDKWSHDHYLHHEDMTKNFGIFFFVWDRVFGTYLK
jgi:sterol desaturase/sphingolipid hydroxylase (fatty acid hydroxylase superfamily)